MTKENDRELKQLRRELAKLDALIDRQLLQVSRRIGNVDTLISREYDRLLREMAEKLREFSKPLLADQRASRREKDRILDGRTSEQKRQAAIKKRIAILEGRLSS